MKKSLLASILAASLCLLTLPFSTNAASEAPDGFYNLTKGQYEYITSNQFLFKSQQEKFKILTGNYYLFMDSLALQAKQILESDTDEALFKALVPAEDIEEKYNITISASGEITEDFKVLSIE